MADNEGLPPVAGHRLPKWLPWVVGGLVLLWVISRARSAGSAGNTPGNLLSGAAPALDPLQQAAQSLQVQNLGTQNARQQALANVDNTAAAQQVVSSDCAKLFADPHFACPGGGRPRVVIQPSWPFVACGCIEPRSGAVTLGSLATLGANIYRAVAGVGGGTPTYNSGSTDVPQPAGYNYGGGQAWGAGPGAIGGGGGGFASNSPTSTV